MTVRKETTEINHVTATEARQDFAETLNRVAYGDETVLIERRGRPVAALMSYKAFKLFQGLMESLEDKLDTEAISASSGEALLDFDVVVKEINNGGGLLSGSDPRKRRRRSA